MMILLQSVRVKRPSVVTAVDVDVDVAAVASAEQWLCVLLTAVSGAAGAGGGQTGNCIGHPRPETSPGHQISPPVDPARHYATPSPLQLTCQRDFAKFHIA